MTAIEMMDELAAQLEGNGDKLQAAYLRGACDGLYEADCDSPSTDAALSEAYVKGYEAAESLTTCG